MPYSKDGCVVRMDDLCQKIQKMFLDGMHYVEISVTQPDSPDEKPCVNFLGIKKNQEDMPFFYDCIDGVNL